MRISDYASLIQAMQDFSHRADIAPFSKYFLQFGELKIYRDIFALNLGNGIRWLEQPFTAPINALTGFVSIPPGYLALKDMQVTDGNGDQLTLKFTDEQYLYTNYALRQPTGVPSYVARDGTNFVFGPFPDDSYVVTGTYYGQGAPLSVGNPNTWMTTNCPELLFASCMMELQPWLRDSDGLQTWQKVYQNKLVGLVDIDTSERYAPGTMTMEVERGARFASGGMAPEGPATNNPTVFSTEAGFMWVTEIGAAVSM